MKEIVGYLLDRETGAGISGKPVTFTKLDGSPVTSADTYWQNTGSGVTDANGMFTGRFELSPGPINTQVTASGSEVKIRKHNEKAMFGYQWSSDISRIARGTKGVIGGYLNGLATAPASGHTIRIQTGAAIFNGAVFSIENNYMDIAGTPNNNSGISTRVDLVTLRQYNETASGQLAGKQQVVITEGVSNDVAPATPVGADFVDFPLATVKTAYGASNKTAGTDLRDYTAETDPIPPPAPLYFGSPAPINANWYGMTTSPVTMQSIAVTGLNPAKIYDGEIFWSFTYNSSGVKQNVYQEIPSGFGYAPAAGDKNILYDEGDPSDNSPTQITWPIIGLTGAATFTYLLRLRGAVGSGTVTAPWGWITLRERR